MYKLETNRINIIALSAKDLVELVQSKNKIEIMQLFGGDENRYLRLMEMVENGLESYRISCMFFLLQLKSTGETIAECGFHTWNKAHNRAEIFYFIFDEIHKRKGYLSEVLPQIIDFGFTNMQLHRIQAMIDDNNIPSKKLLIKNGFTFEGIMRQDYNIDGVNLDSYCYSLLRGEWTERNAE